MIRFSGVLDYRSPPFLTETSSILIYLDYCVGRFGLSMVTNTPRTEIFLDRPLLLGPFSKISFTNIINSSIQRSLYFSEWFFHFLE